MAKRRSRSLSLFQPNHSTTERLEGVVEYDENECVGRHFMVGSDEEALRFESDGEEEDAFHTEHTTKDSMVDDLKFINILVSCTNENVKESYKKSLGKLKTDKIDALNHMTDEEFRTKFDALYKTHGRCRTLFSVVHDMKISLTNCIQKFKHPDKPVYPSLPFLIYMKELKANGEGPPSHQNIFKWASEKYNLLSVRNKSRYIKIHEKQLEKYSQQLEEFYEKYPSERPQKKSSAQITPFNLFFNEINPKGKKKRTEAFEMWKNLPVKKKVGYIKKAYQIQTNEATNNPKVTISIKEKTLLDEHNGKPEKPPSSAYHLFLVEHGDTPDTHTRYKTLNKLEKLQLKEKLIEMIQKYVKSMLNYIKTLPEDFKQLELEELKNVIAKYKLPDSSNPLSLQQNTSKGTICEPQDDIVDTQEQDYVPKKKKKLAAPQTVVDEPKEDTTVFKIKTEVGNENKKTEKKAKKDPETKITKLPKKRDEEVVTKEETPKKRKKSKKEEFTEVKPPKTLFKYFMSINSFGSIDEAKLKFRSQTAKQNKKLDKVYQLMCETYITRLRHYLSSLKEHDMKAFVAQLEQKKAEEEDTSDDLTSSEEDESASGDSN